MSLITINGNKYSQDSITKAEKNQLNDESRKASIEALEELIVLMEPIDSNSDEEAIEIINQLNKAKYVLEQIKNNPDKDYGIGYEIGEQSLLELFETEKQRDDKINML